MRRELLRRWIRGIVAIAIILSIPAVFSRLPRVTDPQRERAEAVRAAERLQRAGSERVVTASGETLRAVIYLPAAPSEAANAAQQRGLVWWSRILAAVIGLGLVSGTWRTLRRRPNRD